MTPEIFVSAAASRSVPVLPGHTLYIIGQNIWLIKKKRLNLSKEKYSLLGQEMPSNDTVQFLVETNITFCKQEKLLWVFTTAQNSKIIASQTNIFFSSKIKN